MDPRRKMRRATSTGPEESPPRTSSVSIPGCFHHRGTHPSVSTGVPTLYISLERIPAATTTAAPTPASSDESPPRTSSERFPDTTTVAPAPTSETIASSSEEATSSVPPGIKAMALLEKIWALPPSTFRPLYPGTVELGTRSVKEAKSWTCQECHNENEPTKHLVFDLPATICGICGFDPPEGAADFAFCFAELGMNGFCPIGNVKKQKILVWQLPFHQL
ncbi:unnamed protein product [Urochloa humidicola]